jgi:hypothetical protein
MDVMTRAHSLSFMHGRVLRTHVRYQPLPTSRTVFLTLPAVAEPASKTTAAQ